MSKVSIIGAGNVGASCAQRLAERNYADIVLVDIADGLPQGRALDILESAPITGFSRRIIGSGEYREAANSDVVVITSGLGRKPGMTRDELLKANVSIVSDVVRRVADCSPDCTIIMVTNPVDAMTYLAVSASGFPHSRVVGLSGVLDGARFRSFISAELEVSASDISACVLGQHGENMVIIPRLTTVGGRPITGLLPQETIDRLVKRTVEGGAEIVGLLKTGSAFYAPSAAVAQMVDAIIRNEKRVLPCAAYLDGEYGIKDSVIGVPVKLGGKGIEQIIELELTGEEKVALVNSANAVRRLIDGMKLG
ncbi:MAG: malate dehydrogenase [Chloroflexi bacterium]|nr:malate dehydrogenase [Chloroflexota bacterium]